MKVQSLQSGVAMPQGIEVKSAHKVERFESPALEKKNSTPSISDMQKEFKETADKGEMERLRKELTKLIDELNEEANPLNLNIKFKFDDEIEQLTVSVYEKDSGKLIKKIPSDEAIALMKKMKEIIGMLLDKKV